MSVYDGYSREYRDFFCNNFIFPVDQEQDQNLHEGFICEKYETTPDSRHNVFYKTFYKEGVHPYPFYYHISEGRKLLNAKKYYRNQNKISVDVEASYYESGALKEIKCHENLFKMTESKTCTKGQKVLFYENNLIVKSGGYRSFNFNATGITLIKQTGVTINKRALAPDKSCKSAKSYEAYSNGVEKYIRLILRNENFPIILGDGTRTFVSSSEDLIILSKEGKVVEVRHGDCGLSY